MAWLHHFSRLTIGQGSIYTCVAPGWQIYKAHTHTILYQLVYEMSGDGNSSNSCISYQPYHTEDYAYVAIASAVSALVTLLASCLVISIMVLFQKWRYFSQRLVLYLAIAALLTAIATVLHRVDYHNQTSDFYLGFCMFGGFLEQITSWMFLNAIISITLYLFASTVLKRDTARLELGYVLFIFVFPLLFNWIPFLHGAYGRSGAWCWIRSQDRVTCESFAFGQWLIFVLWFVPLYVILIILVVLYVIILLSLHRESLRWSGNAASTEEAKELEKKIKRDLLPLMAYPLIYFLLSIPPFINRVQGLAAPDRPVLALWYLSALSFPLQGGLMALAYSLDPDTRRKLNCREMQIALQQYTSSGDETQVEEYPVEYVRDGSIHLRGKGGAAAASDNTRGSGEDTGERNV